MVFRLPSFLSPDRINEGVARSWAGRWFRLDGSGHPLERPGSKFLTELRAGTVTAAAMLYIISVNASILSDSGGPCVCESTASDPICLANEAYNLCKNELRRDYVTATSAISLIATFLMGALANLPLGLAPGLGVNAYFAYSQVGFNGTGPITYNEAVAAVFLEGIIFFALTILGLRQWLARMIPRSITYAIGVGIGLFLTIIGLSSSGLGVISGGSATPLTLAGCLEEYQVNGICESHVLQDPKLWLGVLCGGVLTAFLLLYRVKGALLWPILLVAIISWPRTTAVTTFPYTTLGDSNFDFFKNVVSARGLRLLGPSNVNWRAYSNGRVWIALISFLYVDLLDTTGTMVAMSKQAGLFNSKDGDFEGSSVGFLVDSSCVAMSGLFFGTSPCTPFVESASGISEGGRTGLTAIATSFWFFVSIFFAPLLSNIPSWATGSVLIVVGALMMENVTKINWDYLGDAIPAFVGLALIPFTYNIAYGIIAALVLWILFHNVPLLLQRISPRLLPPGWNDLKEPYDIGAMMRMQDTHGRSRAFALLPPWLRKALSGNRRFWAYTPEEIQRQLDGREMSRNADVAAAELRQKERDEMRKVLGHLTVGEVPEAPFDVERPGARTTLDVDGQGSQRSYEMEGKDMATAEAKRRDRDLKSGLMSPTQFESEARP